MYGAKITGVGSCLPNRVVTNEEIADEMLARRNAYDGRGVCGSDPNWRVQFECSADWILERTGIRERRRAAPTEATSDLAARAAKAALAMSGLRLDAIGFVLVATVTPDHLASPPTAALVQNWLSLSRQIFAIDLSDACCSFLGALKITYGLIRSGLHKAGLVIGADVMSRMANPNDRPTYPLLRDGAGCFVLERTSELEDQFKPGGWCSGCDGSKAELIITPAGGSRLPITEDNATDITGPDGYKHRLAMDGRPVYKWVVPFLSEVLIPQALEQAAISLATVDAIIFHQANLKMIEAIRKRLDYNGVVFNNIAHLGNTSSASIPLACAEALESGVIRPGMTVLLVAFGGGVTWATALWRNELSPEPPI